MESSGGGGRVACRPVAGRRAFFVTAVPRIYEEFDDFAFALPTETEQTFASRSSSETTFHPRAAGAGAGCGIVGWCNGSGGATPPGVGRDCFARAHSPPVKQVPVVGRCRSRNSLPPFGKGTSVSAGGAPVANRFGKKRKRTLRAANVEFTSSNIHLQTERNRAIWHFGEFKELKPVGETNVWAPIQGMPMQRVPPDGNWEVRGEGDLKHIRSKRRLYCTAAGRKWPYLQPGDHGGV